MEGWLNRFIESQKDKITESTMKSYISDIKLFNKYLLDEEIDVKFLNDEKREELIEDYKLYLLNNRFKATSINRKLLSIGKCLKSVEKDTKIEFLKIHKTQILEDVITLNEVEKLLNVCNDPRDKAIILTLSKMGLRVSEILEIKITDIYRDSIEFKGKRKKYRTVVVPDKVKIAWNEYIKVRPKTKIKQLFIGKRGALKRQAINALLIKYQKKAKVKRKKVHPHNFRHSCFKNLSDLGVGIEVIADIAGHESLDTTRIYTRRTKKELKKIMDY